MGCPAINFRAKLCSHTFAETLFAFIYKARAWLTRGTGYETLQHWVSGSRSRSIMIQGAQMGGFFPAEGTRLL